MSRFLRPPISDDVLALVSRLRNAGDADRIYAQSASQRYLDAFAKKHHVKAARRADLCRLVSKRCWTHCLNNVWQPIGIDHPTLWLRDRKAVCFTFEPYQLLTESVLALATMANELKLEITISTDSWHFPTGTLLVELWNTHERT